MQQTGYVMVNDEKILVLIRVSRLYNYLKLRESGKDGVFMEDESNWLNERPDLVESLKDGNVIRC